MKGARAGLRKSLKAISPVISILLTIIVAVVVGLIFYTWSTVFLGTQQTKAGTEIKIESAAFSRNDTKCATCHYAKFNGTVISYNKPADRKSCYKDGTYCHLLDSSIWGVSEDYISKYKPYGIYADYSGFQAKYKNKLGSYGWYPAQTVTEHDTNQTIIYGKQATCTSKPGCHTNVHDELECFYCHNHTYRRGLAYSPSSYHDKMLHTDVTGPECVKCHGLPHGSSAVTIYVRNTGTVATNIGHLYINEKEYQFYVVYPSLDALNDGLTKGEIVGIRPTAFAWQPNTKYEFKITTTTGLEIKATYTSPSNLNPG